MQRGITGMYMYALESEYSLYHCIICIYSWTMPKYFIKYLYLYYIFILNSMPTNTVEVQHGFKQVSELGLFKIIITLCF